MVAVLEHELRASVRVFRLVALLVRLVAMQEQLLS
jgi:hypothetical protein